MGALGAINKPGTLASSEHGVAAAMALQVPEHADHDWVTVFLVGFLAVLILSKRSMFGRRSLGGKFINLQSFHNSMG
jgi:hypothetical protein